MVESSRTKTSNQPLENVPKRLQMNTINETLSLRRLDPIEIPGSRQSPGAAPGSTGLGTRSADDYNVSIMDTCRQIGNVQRSVGCMFILMLRYTYLSC